MFAIVSAVIRRGRPARAVRRTRNVHRAPDAEARGRAGRALPVDGDLLERRVAARSPTSPGSGEQSRSACYASAVPLGRFLPYEGSRRSIVVSHLTRNRSFSPRTLFQVRRTVFR